MLCLLHRSCLCTQSIVLTVKDGSALTRWYFWLCFVFFFDKKHAAFKWKDIISGFPVSPGSSEALVKWGGKIKYVLVAYFFGNIFAKNCCSRTVYVKIIASQRWDVFETQCITRLAGLDVGRRITCLMNLLHLSATMSCRSPTQSYTNFSKEVH